MTTGFNDRLRQLLLLAIIISLACLLISELYVFLPGLLGGITLYILSRTFFSHLVFVKKWRKGLTALLFIIGYLVLIFIPVYFSVKLVSPKITNMINNQDSIMNDLRTFFSKVKD